MKSWKHFPHLAGQRSWWLWGSAPSAFELWEGTKGAGVMVDPLQPRDWITWAFAVARVSLEISWIYPSAIPRWTKRGAPSQISAWGGCQSALAQVLDHLQIMGKEPQLFHSQRLQQHPKRCLVHLLMWPAKNLAWVFSKCFFGSPGALLSGGRLQNVWLKMRGGFCPDVISADGSSPGRFSEYKHCSQLGSGGGTTYC